ncbi:MULTISPECIES: hypothetical protein [unclassified Nonomuraea]|uniref:hypothetical protein n=1 Tax=unclassified Nonomuraea TaxID=2593643 RepID=UPI0033E63235
MDPSPRRQIEKSLATAAQHKPIAWRLILPLEHTPPEKAWFDELQAQYPKILLAWQGIDWLDEQLARHVQAPGGGWRRPRERGWSRSARSRR